MQTERQVAANPQTKPTDLGCESAERLAAIPSADTIAIYYYYSARKLILILPSHGRWKAESAVKMTVKTGIPKGLNKR